MSGPCRHKGDSLYSVPASFYCSPCPSHSGDACPKPFQSTDCGHSHCNLSPDLSLLPSVLLLTGLCDGPGPGSSHAVLVLLIDHDPWSWLCPHVCTSWWEHRVLWACPPQKSALFLLLPDSRYRNTLVLIHCLNRNDEGFALKPRHGVGHPWTHPWKLRKPTGACLELNQMLLFYSCI